MERRAFLAAALVAPVAIATPAMAQALICHAADPVDEFWSAFHAYDEDDPASEERLSQATDALDYWQPPTARDFVRKFLAMFDEHGSPSAERMKVIIEQAQRLV